jgi:hypothetical protein
MQNSTQYNLKIPDFWLKYTFPVCFIYVYVIDFDIFCKVASTITTHMFGLWELVFENYNT